MRSVSLILAAWAAMLGVEMLGVAMPAARAQDAPQILSAFALSRINEPSAHMVQFYGAAQSMRVVRQPHQPASHRMAARS